MPDENIIEVGGKAYHEDKTGGVGRVLQPGGEAPVLGGVHPEFVTVPRDPHALLGVTAVMYAKVMGERQ